jgi:hypothetical protein
MERIVIDGKLKDASTWSSVMERLSVNELVVASVMSIETCLFPDYLPSTSYEFFGPSPCYGRNCLHNIGNGYVLGSCSPKRQMKARKFHSSLTIPLPAVLIFWKPDFATHGSIYPQNQAILY